MAKVIITIEDIHNGLVAISFTGDIPAIEEQKNLKPCPANRCPDAKYGRSGTDDGTAAKADKLTNSGQRCPLFKGRLNWSI